MLNLLRVSFLRKTLTLRVDLMPTSRFGYHKSIKILKLMILKAKSIFKTLVLIMRKIQKNEKNSKKTSTIEISICLFIYIIHTISTH